MQDFIVSKLVAGSGEQDKYLTICLPLISSIELFVSKAIFVGRVSTFITLSVIGVEWWRVRNRKKKEKKKKGSCRISN